MASRLSVDLRSSVSTELASVPVGWDGSDDSCTCKSLRATAFSPRGRDLSIPLERLRVSDVDFIKTSECFHQEADAAETATSPCFASFTSRSQKEAQGEGDLEIPAEHHPDIAYPSEHPPTQYRGLDDSFGLTEAGEPSHTSREASSVELPASPQAKSSSQRESDRTEAVHSHLLGPPNLEEALRHLQDTSATDKNDQWLSPMKTSRAEMGQFGVGVELYFNFVCQLGFLFCTLALLSLFPLIVYSSGSMITDGKALFQFERTVIANLGVRETIPAGLSPADTQKMIRQRPVTLAGGKSMDIQDVTLACGIIDALCLLIFLSWVWVFRHRHIPQIVAKNDAANVTPPDYAIAIMQLPRRLEKHEDYERCLREHFLQFCEPDQSLMSVDETTGEILDRRIVEVTLVREYDGKVADYLKSGALKWETEKMRARQKLGAPFPEKKYRQMTQKVEEIELRLAAEAIEDDDREVCMAFVIFNKEEDKERVLEWYSWSRIRMLHWFQAERLRFRHHRLYVRQAPEPTNILWENLDFEKWKRRLRILLTFGATLTLLVICGLAIAFTKRYVEAQKRGVPDKGEMWRALIRLEPEEEITLCDVKLFSEYNCSGVIAPSESSSPTIISDGQVFSTATRGCADNAFFDNLSTNDFAASRGESRPDLGWIGFRFPAITPARCMEFSVPSPTPPSIANLSISVETCQILEEQTTPSSTPPVYVCTKIQFHDQVIEGRNRVPFTALRSARSDQCGGTSETSHLTFKNAQALAEKQKMVSSSGNKNKINDFYLGCYCGLHKFQVLQTPGLAELCAEHYSETGVIVVLGFLSAFVIVFINMLLKNVLVALSNWEKPFFVSILFRSRVMKVFVAQWLNTGVIILILNAKYGSRVAIGTTDFTGAYGDFNAEWYIRIGVAILLTVFINVFSPHCIYALFFPWRVWKRTARAKRCVIQEDLNQVYSNPPFGFDVRYAQLLQTTWVVMMYSAGMPLLYALAGACCFVIAICDRFLFLWGSARPPAFDEVTVITVVETLPIAAALHAIVAVIMFGNATVFPSRPLFGSAEAVEATNSDPYSFYWDGAQSFASEFSPSSHSLLYRFTNRATFLQLVILGLWVACYILSFSYFFFSNFKGVCISYWRGKQDDSRLDGGKKDSSFTLAPHTQVTSGTFEENAMEMKENDLVTSYRMEANPKYRKAYNAVHRVHKRRQTIAPTPRGPRTRKLTIPLSIHTRKRSAAHVISQETTGLDSSADQIGQSQTLHSPHAQQPASARPPQDPDDEAS